MGETLSETGEETLQPNCAVMNGNSSLAACAHFSPTNWITARLYMVKEMGHGHTLIAIVTSC